VTDSQSNLNTVSLFNWPYRLTARTQDSHSCNRGSIPRRVTNEGDIFINVFQNTLKGNQDYFLSERNIAIKMEEGVVIQNRIEDLILTFTQNNAIIKIVCSLQLPALGAKIRAITVGSAIVKRGTPLTQALRSICDGNHRFRKGPDYRRIAWTAVHTFRSWYGVHPNALVGGKQAAEIQTGTCRPGTHQARCGGGWNTSGEYCDLSRAQLSAVHDRHLRPRTLRPHLRRMVSH